MVSVLRESGKGIVERRQPFLVFHQAGARVAQSALRQGDFKIVKHWAENRVELFNLKEDLAEQKDLAAENRKRCNEMERSLELFLESVGALTERNITKAEQREMFAEPAP
jgi:hypothetical protein